MKRGRAIKVTRASRRGAPPATAAPRGRRGAPRRGGRIPRRARAPPCSRGGRRGRVDDGGKDVGTQLRTRSFRGPSRAIAKSAEKNPRNATRRRPPGACVRELVHETGGYRWGNVHAAPRRERPRNARENTIANTAFATQRSGLGGRWGRRPRERVSPRHRGSGNTVPYAIARARMSA